LKKYRGRKREKGREPKAKSMVPGAKSFLI
jgi:hypothetical protein